MTLNPHLTNRCRLVLSSALLAGALSAPLTLAAQEAAHSTATHAAEAGAAEHGTEHEEGWLPTVAKVVNFAALAGVLVYFLRSPLVQHLSQRSATIRKDLVDAHELRASADAQLKSVHARLAELPKEIEDLRTRGAEELANERVRMSQATAREREKLLERTRREIDLQFRTSRRELVEHTANLAMSLTRARLEQTITADDQQRLLDRYATELHS